MEKTAEPNTKKPMKYLIVVGSTISGIGKGTTISCIGVLLQSLGMIVTSLKIDPYFNVDAGLMNPYEHGEVFVLDDGGETDLDLGNYERSLNIKLTSKHNITSGKVFLEVISNERKGLYLGKTVQLIPHVTDKIVEKIEEASEIITDKQGRRADICLIEVGGTIGDLESNIHLEAIRQFISLKGRENCIVMLLTYIPEVGVTKEQKTKPTQQGSKELKSFGINAEFIICRSTSELEQNSLRKIAFYCDVKEENVISCKNVDMFWAVPIVLSKQRLHYKIMESFGLDNKGIDDVAKWENYYTTISKIKNLDPIKIVICGKYVSNMDSYYSITKALTEASYASGNNIKIMSLDTEFLEDDSKFHTKEQNEESWNTLKQANGILVPGGTIQ